MEVSPGDDVEWLSVCEHFMRVRTERRRKWRVWKLMIPTSKLKGSNNVHYSQAG